MAALSSASGTGHDEPECWSVGPGPNSRGLVGEWEDVLAATHVAFDVRFTHRTPNTFSGTVVRRRFGELALVDCVCAPFAGHRGVVMGDEGESSIGFQVVREGTERIRYRSTVHTVSPGEAVLWDGSHPVDVEVVEPFVKRTLILPRDRVLAVCPRLDDLGALPALGETPAARLLARYLDALASELPGLGSGADDTIGTVTDVALELLRAAVEPGVPESRTTRRDALRAHVRRYIRRNLQDPGLGPESIAKAHAVSLRSLHGLFEDTGESVAALVRQHRLSRCRSDLERPSAGSVSEIAFRWGFSDAAHFSTVFKREYGVTPSEVRRAALSGARIGKDPGTDTHAPETGRP